MAVEAKGSNYSFRTGIIITVASIAFGAYFFYDGWISESYQQKETDPETGETTFNLKFNRVYGPIVCGLAAGYFLIGALTLRRKRLVAEGEGLRFSGGQFIPYGAMKAINRTPLQKKGYFTIDYEEEGQRKTLKLTERVYDNLGLLLDEIVKQTGAKPQEPSSDDDGSA